MSTPYVGIKQFLKHASVASPPEQGSPWMPQGFPDAQSAADYRQEVKRRLAHVLEHYLGIQTLQVGAFAFKISSPAIPEQSLIDATTALVAQLKQEQDPSPQLEILEDCLQNLLRL